VFLVHSLTGEGTYLDAVAVLVQKMVDAFARSHLTLGVMLFDSLLSASKANFGQAFAQLGAQ
jgi:hypothetical protein